MGQLALSPSTKKMTILTRSCLRHNTLPRGWKVISARPVNSNSLQRFYLSPEGKRFQSLQTAKAWLISTLEAYERSELTENSKRRRKSMAERNPFRNLLRTTLKKNYKVEKSKSRKHSIVNNILSQRRKLRTSSGISLKRKSNTRSII